MDFLPYLFEALIFLASLLVALFVFALLPLFIVDFLTVCSREQYGVERAKKVRIIAIAAYAPVLPLIATIVTLGVWHEPIGFAASMIIGSLGASLALCGAIAAATVKSLKPEEPTSTTNPDQ